MPESIIQDTYVDQIPQFKLPDEMTKTEAPKEEPKPQEKPAEATDAVAPKEPEKETPEETTRKDEEKQPSSRFERRIDRAHRRAAEAQARAERLEQELAELRKKSEPAPVAERPKMENFSSVEEYERAVDKYVDEQKENAKREYTLEQQRQTQAQAVQKVTSQWQEHVERGGDKYDDFEEVVGDLKPTTPWAIAIMEAENGDEIAYYLGKNPKEAQRIIALNPMSQIREIGKLEHRLSLKPVEPKTPSKAPPPIAPVTGATEAPSDELKPEMSPEQYMKVGRKLFGGFG